MKPLPLLRWLGVMCAATGFLYAADTDINELDQLMRRFTEVYALVEEQAADPVDVNNAFYNGAIPGMLRRLDPHTVFFDPQQFRQLQEMETSTHKGFGTIVSVLSGRVIVLQTMTGTPAAGSGLEPGDEILAINGIDLARLNMDQIVGLLSQSRQETVHLDVRKPGNARLLQFVLNPAEMEAPSVDLAFFLRAAVAYVRVKSFEANTGRLLQQTIDRHGGKNLRGLVLDLRGNAGGLLSAAIGTATLFLPPDSLILTARGRGEVKEEIRVVLAADPYQFPVVVLIDERTASAAEIIAGAFQDHKRATIVGRRSYGKGLVQSVYPLSESTALALTTAFYYTPDGKFIQRPLPGVQLLHANPVENPGGITPDIEPAAAPYTRLKAVLDATGYFTTFATSALRKLGRIEEDFEVSPALLDEFQLFLVQRNIQPGVAEWSENRGWIRVRLQQEIFNQALGVGKGDEVEMENDPVVRKGLEVLGVL